MLGNSGVTKADVLAAFAESHENQLALAGSMENGIYFKVFT